jgi:chemotaxis protein CheD
LTDEIRDRPVRSVFIGQFALSDGECALAVHGLGSCVALILFESRLGMGGLAHVLLPGEQLASDTAQDLPAKYASRALDILHTGLTQRGARAASVKAILVGGARMFESDADLDQGVGQRNVESLKQMLRSRGIAIAAESTGGGQGRTVIFDLPECRLRIRTLRDGWSEKQLK